MPQSRSSSLHWLAMSRSGADAAVAGRRGDVSNSSGSTLDLTLGAHLRFPPGLFRRLERAKRISRQRSHGRALIDAAGYLPEGCLWPCAEIQPGGYRRRREYARCPRPAFAELERAVAKSLR